VQLDGIGRRLDGDRTAAPGTPAGPAGPSDNRDSDGPVFVDESGRRSRRFRRIGIAVGVACGLYALVIVATLLSGNSAAPWVPVPIPGADDGNPASKVEDSTRPTDSADPSAATGGVLPGVSTDPGDPSAGVTPSAGGSAAPGASAGSSKKPGVATSTKPKPSVSSSKATTTGGGSGSKGTTGGTSTGTGSTGTGTTTGTGDTSGTGTSTGTGDTGTGTTTGTGDTSGTTNSANGPTDQTQVASSATTPTSPENTL
jgi:hypothetical protein